MEYKETHEEETTENIIKEGLKDGEMSIDHIVSDEQYELILELLSEDEIPRKTFGQISFYLLFLAESNIFKDSHLLLRLFHFLPLWEQTNNIASNILFALMKQDKGIIAALCELDEIEEILIVPTVVNSKVIEWISLAINEIPEMNNKMNEIGLFHSFLENAFHQPAFNAALFRQNIGFIYREISNITEADFIKDAIEMIVEMMPSFIDSFIKWKDNQSSNSLSKFLADKVGKTPQTQEDVLKIQMKIIELTNSFFNDDTMCDLFALITIITTEEQEFLSFVPTIVELISPIIESFSIKTVSRLCFLLSEASNAEQFVITKDIVNITIPKFLSTNSDDIFAVFASFFSEAVKAGGTEMLSFLIENEIPQRFGDLMSEATTKTKGNILSFFISLLDPSVFDLSKDVLEDGLFYSLCEVSLVALDLIREKFFEKLVQLIQHLITTNIWPNETSLSEQLNDSDIKDYLEEKEELTDIEQHLKELINQDEDE